MVRELKVIDKNFVLTDNVDCVFEKIVTRFGTSAKADVPKKYIGKRVYIVVLKN
jgi:putative transposon-encoded protein